MHSLHFFSENSLLFPVEGLTQIKSREFCRHNFIIIIGISVDNLGTDHKKLLLEKEITLIKGGENGLTGRFRALILLLS